MKGSRLDGLLLSLEQVEPGKCWRAPVKLNRTGYAIVAIHKGGARKRTGLHRAFYMKLRGPVPDGLVLDHLCRNRWCVNPWHLEAVTQRENLLRGSGIPAVNAAKTHCLHGHVLEAHPTRVRYCRKCANDRKAEARKQNPKKFSDYQRAWREANRARLIEYRRRYRENKRGAHTGCERIGAR